MIVILSIHVFDDKFPRFENQTTTVLIKILRDGTVKGGTAFLNEKRIKEKRSKIRRKYNICLSWKKKLSFCILNERLDDIKMF